MNAYPLVGQTITRLFLKILPVLLIAGLAFMPATPAGGALISASPENGEFVWARGLGGIEPEQGTDIFVDGAGNVYTTGAFGGTADFDPGPGTFNLTSAGGWDVFVSKLDSSGNFVWAKAFRGATHYTGGYGIFVDGAGGVYTTGRFEGTVDFDPGPGTFKLTCPGIDDVFISKLDSAGNFVWAKSFGGQLFDEGSNIVVDSAGGIYTTGQFESTADFDPGPGTFNLTSAGSGDIFVSKLDSAGDFLWAKAMGGITHDWAKDIFVTPAGDIYTTGEFSRIADFDPGPGTFNLSSGGYDGDIFVSKLDSAGDFVWAKAMGGDDYDTATSIFVGAAGDVYTTGLFQNTADFDPGEGIFNLSSTTGDFEVFISKLDNAGGFVWAKGLDGGSEGAGVFVDGAENVYTTGDFGGTVDFDPGPGTFNLTIVEGTACFVSKLDSAGDFVWAKAFSGQGHVLGNSVFVDGAGNVYTTGAFSGTPDFDPGEGAFTLTSAGQGDVFVSKLGVAARIAVTNQAVRAGGEVTITLTIQNQGPADGGGAQVNIPAPANASRYAWTCAASDGAACPTAGGSGDISHSLPAFPTAGAINYTATGEIINPYFPVASRGTLTPPQGVNFTGSPTFHFGEYWITTLPMVFVNATP
jgi:hypothetical protein